MSDYWMNISISIPTHNRALKNTVHSILHTAYNKQRTHTKYHSKYRINRFFWHQLVNFSSGLLKPQLNAICNFLFFLSYCTSLLQLLTVDCWLAERRWIIRLQFWLKFIFSKWIEQQLAEKRRETRAKKQIRKSN